MRVPGARLHLIAHSVGARLIVEGLLESKTVAAASMRLLQQIMSDKALSSKYDGSLDGEYRGVISEEKVDGPILVTFSRQDQAAVTAYPLAARLSGRGVGAATEGNDPYACMAGYGARFTPEAVEIAPEVSTGAYSFLPSRIYNLNGDKVIDSHTDVANPAVVCAVAAAIIGTLNRPGPDHKHA